MTYQIENRTLTTQPTAAVRASLDTAEMGGWLSGAYAEVMAYLNDVGLTPAGPPFARFTFSDGRADVEAGFPVRAAVHGRGRVVASSLPGGPAAVTTYHGRYEGITVAFDAIAGWLKENGYEADGPHWEVYYTDPQREPDPARWRTDIVAPYRTG